MNETFQTKYQMIFHPGSNCVVLNDAQFHQPVTLNAGGGVKGLPTTAQEIKEAIERLDKEGVLVDDTQWWAVYRVLSEYKGYNTNKSDFCKTIEAMEIHTRVKCNYNNWRNVTTNRLKGKPETWLSLRESVSTAEKKQIEVAEKLMEFLEI